MIYGQLVIDDHLHSSIDVREIIRRNFICVAGLKHGARIDAQADVIEAQRLNERSVLRGRPTLEVLFSVSLGIDNLREPLAGVDAVL